MLSLSLTPSLCCAAAKQVKIKGDCMPPTISYLTAPSPMSALIFSTDLVRLLDEGTRCRLPPTYVGVRRVRPEAPNNAKTRRREGGEGEGEGGSTVVRRGGRDEILHDDGANNDDDVRRSAPNDAIAAAVGPADDDGVDLRRPRNARGDDGENESVNDDERSADDDRDDRYATGADGGRTSSGAARSSSTAIIAMVYRVIDPVSGLERRMTSREKREVKQRTRAEARMTSKEERRRLHEGRIRDAKRGKAERLRCKRMAAASEARGRRTSMGGGTGHDADADATAETDDRTTTKDDGDREGDITTTTRTRRPKGTTTGIGNGDKREQASSSADGGGDSHDGTGTTSTSNDAIRASSSTGSAHRYAEVRADGMDHPSSSAVVVVPCPNALDGAPPSTNVAGGGGRRCHPPAMLAPAATRVAMDLGLLPRSLSPSLLSRHDDCDDNNNSMPTTTMTVMDLELSSEWSRILQRSMMPAETSRAGEEMRTMAYRLVPEPWRRLCPDALWTGTPACSSPPQTRGGAVGGGTAMGSGRRVFSGPGGEIEQDEEDEARASRGVDAGGCDSTREFDGSARAAPASPRPSALVRVRDPSSSRTYDEDAYAVICHIHRYSGLHIACGAAFGCDFLLYDGRREDRHSFAGLRIHSSGRRRRLRCNSGGGDDSHNDGIDANGTSTGGVRFSVPTAYDLSGFVRTMNTARKIALVAMVARDGRRSGENATESTARIAIVDLALEKVLTAHAHIRKGSTTKRRSEEDAASGLARKR